MHSHVEHVDNGDYGLIFLPVRSSGAGSWAAPSVHRGSCWVACEGFERGAALEMSGAFPENWPSTCLASSPRWGVFDTTITRVRISESMPDEKSVGDSWWGSLEANHQWFGEPLSRGFVKIEERNTHKNSQASHIYASGINTSPHLHISHLHSSAIHIVLTSRHLTSIHLHTLNLRTVVDLRALVRSIDFDDRSFHHWSPRGPRENFRRVHEDRIRFHQKMAQVTENRPTCQRQNVAKQSIFSSVPLFFARYSIFKHHLKPGIIFFWFIFISSSSFIFFLHYFLFSFTLFFL